MKIQRLIQKDRNKENTKKRGQIQKKINKSNEGHRKF